MSPPSGRAFDRYLDTDEYQRIERWKAGAPECIAAIHDAGGKAVLAHPCQLGCSHGRLEEILRALKDAGLDGIECFIPALPPNRPPPICVLQTNTASISRGQRFPRGGRPTRYLPYPHSPQPRLAGNLPKCPASPQLIYVRCHKWRLAWYDGFLD